MARPILYTYYRSGAAHRVRIALALKGVSYDSVPVHLVKNGGEQLTSEFRAINPQARVPVLELPNGTRLFQSSAIIEYLEETIPTPPFFPKDPVDRAKVRGVAAIIGADIHPLNNIAVLNTLRHAGLDDEAVAAWIAKWITVGLGAVEQLLIGCEWCFGAEPGLADLYLAPQLFAANRFKVALDQFPKVTRVADSAALHTAFIAALPEMQIDAE